MAGRDLTRAQRAGRLGCGGVAALLLAAAALWPVSRARCFVLIGSVTCRVDTKVQRVALSFDDGPTALGVEAILPELDRHGARATFFLTGRQATQRPDLVKAIVAAGHEVGNHSFTHQRMVGRSTAFYADEIEQTQAALRHAGADPTAFRPPYGKKLIGLPLVLKSARLRLVMWDVEDPATTDPAAFAKDIVEASRPGSIILIHAMYPANATARQALPAILEGLDAKGLSVVSVRELLEAGQAPPERRRG